MLTDHLRIFFGWVSVHCPLFNRIICYFKVSVNLEGKKEKAHEGKEREEGKERRRKRKRESPMHVFCAGPVLGTGDA